MVISISSALINTISTGKKKKSASYLIFKSHTFLYIQDTLKKLFNVFLEQTLGSVDDPFQRNSSIAFSFALRWEEV